MERTSRAISAALAACVLSIALPASRVAYADTVPSFSGPGVSPPGYPDFWGGNLGAKLTQNSEGTFTLSVSGSPEACGDHRLSGCGGTLFNFAGGAYRVGNESMSITANFSSSGQFTSGTYTLIGSLPASSDPTFGKAPSGASWTAQGTETLLTANLTGDTIDTSHEALGFSELITGGWADQTQFTGTSSQTTTESVWLYSLLGGMSRDNDANGDDSCSTRDSRCGGESGGHGRSRGKGHSAWDRFLAELESGHGLKADSFVVKNSIATVPLPGAVWLLGSGLLGLGGLAGRRGRRRSGPRDVSGAGRGFAVQARV